MVVIDIVYMLYVEIHISKYVDIEVIVISLGLIIAGIVTMHGQLVANRENRVKETTFIDD